MQYDLFQITQIAKTNTKKAAKQLLYFVQQKFQNIKAINIKINTSKVSLNSINGFITTKDNEKYFFKFHTEEGEKNTINEYYQSHELANAGLPILKPIYESTTPGSQFLIYENIKAPTAFTEFEKLDENQNTKKEYKLLSAESKLLEKQSQIFLKTLELSNAQDITNSPIYQMFYTRLVSQNNQPPRLDIYYNGKDIELPNKQIINFNDLAQKKWTINGINYNETLLEIINNAKDILNPLKNKKIPTVLGHGDDHNGNKFYINNNFILFDPAFAGRQPALLSFIKATAHNTFLHPFWLYEPAKTKEKGIKFDFKITKNTIEINHNWDTEIQSPIRKKILDLQINKVWRPLIIRLEQKNILPKDYKEYIRKALFCCPFLVYNLIDKNKYSPTESLLALNKCIELGSTGDKENDIERFLKKIK